MTPSKVWEQWDGIGFPTEKPDSIIYYYPGKVDIEEPENLDALIVELHQDGIAESKKDAREMLNSAVVTHGQAIQLDGDLHWYSGAGNGFGEDSYEYSTEATWVEVSVEDE